MRSAWVEECVVCESIVIGVCECCDVFYVLLGDGVGRSSPCLLPLPLPSRESPCSLTPNSSGSMCVCVCESGSFGVRVSGTEV